MDKFDEKKKMILEKIGKFKLYLLVTIVDRDRAKKVNEVLAEKNIKSQFLWFAEGTAKSEILDLLGLGSVDKAVMLNILPDNMVGELASSLSDKLKLEKPGKGIVFAIPLSGAGAPELQKINEDKWKKWQNEMEKEVEQMLLVLQDFDPPGIGARSLQECLLLQVNESIGKLRSL